MTKTALLTLGIYCAAEFFGVFLGGLSVAMTASGAAELPNWTSLTLVVLTALMAPLKTLMPILKSLLVDFGVRMNGDASAVVKAVAKI